MAHHTWETNLSWQQVEAGASSTTLRAGRCCKRKINHAENDDLLAMIFGEGEDQSEGLEVSELGPAVIPKKKAKKQPQLKGKPQSKKNSEKTIKGGGNHRVKKASDKGTKENAQATQKKKWLSKV